MESTLHGMTLAKRLALWLMAAMVVIALGLSAAWQWLGQRALEQEHEAASLRMAALFEASLHDAMLRRDLPGLSQLLQRLGQLPGLEAARLLEPAGQVRFSSLQAELYQAHPEWLQGLCLRAGCSGTPVPARVWQAQGSDRFLRVAYPVANQARCAGCHGPASMRPVNGVLVLDFAPMAAQQMVRSAAAAWMLPASLLALLLLAALAMAVVRRMVLQPVAALVATMSRFTAGDLSVRSGAAGGDEMGRLAQGFDELAHQVQQQVSQLQAHGAYHQALIDTLPDPTVVIAADHRIVQANQAYVRTLGLEGVAVVGQPCHRMSRDRTEPCPATLVMCPLVQMREQSGSMSTVMAFTRRDGSRLDMEINAAAVRGPDGQELLVEVCRPLDHQVRFSQEQRLSAIGLLANGVAHEIHNPLASIRLALQSSLRDLRNGHLARDDLVEYLQLVDEQIDRCVLITQRLMRLSQASGAQAQPVVVADAVHDVVALVNQELGQAQISAEVDIQPAGARLWTDEGELRQVLLNLMQNAIHALPVAGHIRISGRPEGSEYRLEVNDNGTGIEPDVLPHIFLPFYSRRARGQRGTGMGLAICKALVEQRGGRIEVRSQLGRGTSFDVVLPCAESVPFREDKV